MSISHVFMYWCDAPCVVNEGLKTGSFLFVDGIVAASRETWAVVAAHHLAAAYRPEGLS